MKTFVLRTNSLLSSTDSTLRFGSDNEVVIPLAVIDELQHYKGRPEKCKVASQILEYLETFDIQELTSKGVMQENGSILKIAKNYHDVEVKLEEISDKDRRIYQVCLGIKKEFPEKKVILISKNASARIKARMLGIEAEDFRDDLFPVLSEQYTGREKIYVSSEAMDKFYKENELSLTEVYEGEKIHWEQNMFVEIHSHDSNGSALGRYDGKKLVHLTFDQSQRPCGIMTKNAGQRMLMESLMQNWEEAPLVLAKGPAGTGKTYCALAYALSQLDDITSKHSRIIVAAPSETVGNEKLGYLPGEIENKMSPYIGGIKDNLNQIKRNSKNSSRDEDYENPADYYIKAGLIEIQPVGFVRGRTITDSIVIVDETQNIDPGDIKSIVTRAGKNSKFIFLGDPSQVDNPKLNERYNGLVYLSEKMKGLSQCWQITMEGEESVRSELSKLAAQIL